MNRLDQIEELTGSPARTLGGHLADSGRPGLAECPHEISEVVATHYAITRSGRLFHWRFSELRELPAHEGAFTIKVRGVRWVVERATLRGRAWPRASDTEPPEGWDWADYDADDPPPDWMALGPQSPRSEGGPSPIQNNPANQEAVDRAHRLFYGA